MTLQGGPLDEFVGTLLAPDRKISIGGHGTVIGQVISGQPIVLSGGGSARCRCPAP